MRVRDGAGACLLAACMAAFAAAEPAFLRPWAARAQDLVLLLVPNAPARNVCVVIAADAASRREVGPWPWPASVAGRLLDRIARGNPRAIGVVSCPASSDGGRPLADAARRAGNVASGFALRFGYQSSAGGPPAPRNARIRYVTNPWGKAREYRMPKADGTGCVDVALAESTSSAGFTNVPRPEDRDSREPPSGLPRFPRGGDPMVRGAPLVSAEGDGFLMSLPLALASTVLKTARVTLRLKGGAADGIELDGRLIPIDARGMLRLVPSRGGRGPKIVSAADVLFGRAEASQWAGKVVVLGECEAPLPARRWGRLPASAPAALLHAETVDALLAGRFLRRPRLAALLELALAAVFPFVARGIFRRSGRGARRGWAALAAALAVCAGAGIVAFAAHGEEIRPFYPAVSAVVSWVAYGVPGRRGARVS